MKKLLLMVLSVTMCAAFTQAQEITGMVKEENGKALSGASVTLKKVKDSSVVKLGATNATGHYRFAHIPAGNYFVNISFIGYVPQNTHPFQVTGDGGYQVPEVSMVKAAGKLKEAVVTYHKPIVEVKADKTILNVEGTVNAVGQDALELLRKSPGVMVDKDDNLSLSGKNGVKVYIDGRPTPLSGQDLSEYLKTIQSSQIESIEIITNPSAKYDAAGNAGIINIRLKKNRSYGTNGSLTAGYNIGTFPKYNAGLALNHRDKSINLYGNYNYNRRRNEFQMSLHREQLDTLFDQHSNIGPRNETHTFKAGLDYTVNKKVTVGAMVDGNFTKNSIGNYSRTLISYIPTGEEDKILIANNSSSGFRNNVDGNLNFRYADTSGHEWTMDADYGLYRIKSDQYQPNYYYDPSGNTLLDSHIYNMIAPTDIDIYSFKTDYEQNFKKGKLGFGAKTSYVKSNNNFDRYNVYTNYKNLDTLRSNDFDYTENVNAVYANYNRAFKGFMIQAGLRVENTNATGRSKGYRLSGNDYEPYDSSFHRHYTDLFPSAAITFNKKPTKQWTISYSRRIDRPAYQDLNPFEFKLDEYTFQKGNTQLTPQYTNSVALTYVYKYRLTTTLTYSHVKDVFTQLIDTADKSKAYITKKNLATQDITSLNISYPFQYKWYSVFGNLNAYYSHYKANFGVGRTIDLDVWAVTLYAQNSFRLGKGWTGEISGFYNSPSIWQGTFKTSQMWSVDAGLQKAILKGKGNLKASVSDIFHTLQWTATSNFAGQYLKAHGGFESRQFKLNFTYRFGNNRVKAARQRKTGMEEETKRVGTQGGGLGGGNNK